MGCIAKYLLSALAFLAFSSFGWITFPAGASIWLSAILISLVVLVIDILLLVFQAILYIIALPLIVLTDGLFALAIGGIFKYFSLLLAASITGLFVMPWIFGPMWLQAFVIGLVFSVISAIGAKSS